MSDPAGLVVSSNLTIPEGELTETFQTSGGPGGQHANRSATSVALVWQYDESTVLDEVEKRRLAANLGNRGAGGTLRVVADSSRSQWRNRSLARARMSELVAEALRPPQAPRRATKPSRAAKRRRVDAKKRRGKTKQLRRPPEPE